MGDIARVVSVLNGDAPTSEFDAVIASYDDKKESEDKQWLKIIAAIKSVHSELMRLRNLKTPSNTAAVKVDDGDLDLDNKKLRDENERLSSQLSELQSAREDEKVRLSEEKARMQSLMAAQTRKSEEAEKKFRQDLRAKESDKKRLEEEIAQLKQSNTANTSDAEAETEDKGRERRFKFEMDELRHKYESEIKTLTIDKQRLETQLKSANLSASKHSVQTNLNGASTSSVNGQSEAEKDETIAKLMRENEQSMFVVKAKDEIIANANAKIAELKAQIAVMKKEEKEEEVQLGKVGKDRAQKLMEERIKHQQQNSLNAPSDGGPKKTMAEMLKESTKADAMNIIHGMGCLKFEWDKKLKRDTYTLDLTNNTVLRRLLDSNRKQFMFLLAHTLCDDSGGQKVEKVRMSNKGITDKLFPEFMKIMVENIEHFAAEELTLESNKIGNEGMKMLALFLEKNPRTLREIKMYNNKDNVSTPVINQLLTAIEKNDRLCKFTFEWRLTQHRDRIEKQLNKNQDKRRKEKWAKK